MMKTLDYYMCPQCHYNCNHAKSIQKRNTIPRLYNAELANSEGQCGSRQCIRDFSPNTGTAGAQINGDIALVVPRLLTQEEDQGQGVEQTPPNAARRCCSTAEP